MTPREIVLANLNHQPVPRCGMDFDRNRYNDLVMAWRGNPAGYTPRRWREGEREFYDDAWGNIWVRMIDGSVKGEVFEPAIKDWSQLDDLRVPAYDIEQVADQFRKTFADDTRQRCRLAGIGGWVFDNARYLRKMEVYFADMVLYPEELHRLHAKVGSMYEGLIHAAGRAGADAVVIGEDLGTQQGLLFSPAMFREYFKPLYTRLVAIAHDYGMKVLMHSCGKNWALLDDLLDVGIDCFQFDQPAVYDMPALAEKLRRRKGSLWSPCDIQRVLPTGDRAFIESETEKMYRLFEGFLIAKNYPDLPGIGVKTEWDDWAYRVFCRLGGLPAGGPA